MLTSATRHVNPSLIRWTRKAIAGGAALVVAGVAMAACTSSGPTLGAPARKSILASGPTISGHEAATRSAAEIGARVSAPSPLIVRTGSLTLQLKPGSLTRVFDQVSAQADSLGGFVSSSATTGTATASLVLRAPSDDFSKLVDEISGDGHTLGEQLNGQDVTGETIDLQARITNLTAEESSLRSLMARAGSISSILDVQDQLFTVEGEIEQLTAQESSLVNQATFATLDVALQSSAPAHRSAPSAVGRSVSLAERNTVAVVRGIVLALGWAFPAAAVALVAGAVLWVRRRRRPGSGGADAGPTPVAAP